jgi:hypothetical protein
MSNGHGSQYGYRVFSHILLKDTKKIPKKIPRFRRFSCPIREFIILFMAKKLSKNKLKEYAYDKFAEVFGPQGHDQWPDGQALDIFLDDYDKEYPYDASDIDDFIQMCLDQYRDQWWQKDMEMPLAWNGKVPKKGS